MNSGGPPQRDLYEELCDLSSQAVARIHDGLHDLKDGDLHRVCMDILWARHGSPGGYWDVRDLELGAILLSIDHAAVECSPRLRVAKMVLQCAQARSITDENHQVRRRLEWSYIASDGRQRTFDHVECTCGDRSDISDRQGGLVLRKVLLKGDASVWPCLTIPRINNGHPVFVVCKFADHAQDPRHAPDADGFYCMCGGTLGVHNSEGVTDKYLSAQ